MQRCNSQDERDALECLLYAIGSNNESLRSNNGFNAEILQSIIDSSLIEQPSANYSFYHFTFTDTFFTAYKKRETVNWQKEGF